jgi:hypothetical protein
MSLDKREQEVFAGIVAEVIASDGNTAGSTGLRRS